MLKSYLPIANIPIQLSNPLNVTHINSIQRPCVPVPEHVTLPPVSNL